MASAEIEQRSGLSTGLTGMFIAAGMLIVALVLGHMGRSYKATRTVRLDRPWPISDCLPLFLQAL